jgi:uncharacterized protein (TIGR03435 family)
MINGTVRMLIAWAHEPGDADVVGLPDWSNDERFDVVAKASYDASTADMRAMVRALLADRFQLRTHVEHRDQSIYSMVIANEDGRLGPRLRRVDEDCDELVDAIMRGRMTPLFAPRRRALAGRGLSSR